MTLADLLASHGGRGVLRPRRSPSDEAATARLCPTTRRRSTHRHSQSVRRRRPEAAPAYAAIHQLQWRLRPRALVRQGAGLRDSKQIIVQRE
eukprot:scaffold56961_cov26-Tisochrysis_lutea.AAC.8